MKLAILGGSFNPVHFGHLYLADIVLQNHGYDRVIFVPAYQSPFKIAAGISSSSQDRLDMLAASVAGDSRLGIDDCEIKRKGVSYTIDTLRDIIGRYHPDGKPGLVIGDDLAADFPKWKGYTEILELAGIIVARRFREKERGLWSFPCHLLDNEVMDISSRMVRELILTGGAWKSLVPAGAGAIIEDRNLYRKTSENAGIALSFVMRVEDEARRRLGTGRFLHSRGVALLSSDMCRRWGLDPRAGYLAGISHDICKPLKEPELLALAAKDGEKIQKFERQKPGVLHGRAAAVFLGEYFGLENKDVLEAVRLHTTGRAGMGPLAKIVYMADKLEVTREKVDPMMRRMAYGKDDCELDALFFRVVENAVSWLEAKDIAVAEGTLALLSQEGREKR